LILRSLVVLALAAAFLVGGLLVDYSRFLQTPVTLAETTSLYEVERGVSLRRVAQDLTRLGVLEHPYYLELLALRQGEGARLKTGEYELTRGLLPLGLLERLGSGRSIQYPITLVEGWTFRQAVAAVLASGRFGIDLAGKGEAELMSELGHPGEHPEGRLFPDTYSFPRRTSGIEVLRRAFERMDQVLAEEWAGRAEPLPIATPYEALILASIVEKETAVAAERPAIAGVFARRLRLGMRLQTDPTVIYGLGERYDGNIRRADLREPTPYNTYTILGLPPTPIALPGREAIHAALHPQGGDSLYFVARGDGTHSFSATLEQHNRAVRTFQLGQPGTPAKGGDQ
jgi:UPF0755 protein